MDFGATLPGNIYIYVSIYIHLLSFLCFNIFHLDDLYTIQDDETCTQCICMSSIICGNWHMFIKKVAGLEFGNTTIFLGC